MNQQEEISLIKKQNELILERLNSLDDGTFAALSTNIRRPSTSSTTFPVDVSSLSARENIRKLLRHLQPSPLTCHLYQLVEILTNPLRRSQPLLLMCHLYQLVEIFADPLRRPQPSPLT
ncbi:unnamed protein product [Rhizophagus irregularis]|uniref:Uncharacterized protein n=1 Tax=Rhizophagus irregularis TaxID=588596 RepID=A0A915ZJG8_9GLOM|nr:unnamed protein product [Rhizophagus irregularis]CAB5211528.1 unnamed protein product [Rhizophagus irregularis]CAB5377183.1 unnamed protein product [Rhizophagus irregularis]